MSKKEVSAQHSLLLGTSWPKWRLWPDSAGFPTVQFCMGGQDPPFDPPFAGFFEGGPTHSKLRGGLHTCLRS